MLALFDYGKKTAKNLIISSLSETWPLSAKKLYNMLKKRHAVGFTYQAVHFALKELVQQGILACQKRQYMLSPEWVEKINESATNLVEKYSKRGLATKPKELLELTFQTAAEAWNFVLSHMGTDFFGESNLFYAQLRKLFPFPLSSNQIGEVKKFCAANDVLILCAGNSLIDKVVARFLRKLGAKVYLGVCCAQPTNTIVFKDSVLSVYILYTEKEMEKFEKKVAKLQNFNSNVGELLKDDVLSKSSSFVAKKLKVKIVINRDPAVKANVMWLTRRLIPKAQVK